MSARDRQLLSRVVRDFRRRRRAPLRAMAPVLRVHPSTVSRWSRERGPRRLPGRPRRRVNLCVCCQVLAKVCSKAGRITVRALKRLFPAASRSWLRDVLRRDHRRRADRRRQWRFELGWTWPGTVWAMDFTSLGGRGSDRALCVRDLASCKVLYAAVVGPTAARETYQVVARLFAEHGAPLVLKAGVCNERCNRRVAGGIL